MASMPMPCISLDAYDNDDVSLLQGALTRVDTAVMAGLEALGLRRRAPVSIAVADIAARAELTIEENRASACHGSATTSGATARTLSSRGGCTNRSTPASGGTLIGGKSR